LLAARTPLGLGVTNLPDFFALNTLSIIPFAFSVTLTATAAPASLHYIIVKSYLLIYQQLHHKQFFLLPFLYDL
jgi:hypothetical protein